MSNLYRITTIALCFLLPIAIGSFLLIQSKVITIPSSPGVSFIELTIDKNTVSIISNADYLDLNINNQSLRLFFTSIEFKNQYISNWNTLSLSNGEQKVLPPASCNQLVLRFPVTYGRINENIKIGDPNGPRMLCQ